jgi:hypothetical protein
MSFSGTITRYGSCSAFGRASGVPNSTCVPGFSPCLCSNVTGDCTQSFCAVVNVSVSVPPFAGFWGYYIYTSTDCTGNISSFFSTEIGRCSGRYNLYNQSLFALCQTFLYEIRYYASLDCSTSGTPVYASTVCSTSSQSGFGNRAVCPPTQTQSPTPVPSSGLTPGVIAGIVVGCIVLLVLIILGCIFLGPAKCLEVMFCCCG